MASADFVGVSFLVIAQAPFHRAASTVVLHAIADEGCDLAVVALERDLDLELALGDQQQGLHVLGQAHQVGSVVEIPDGGVVLSHRSSLRPGEVTAYSR